MKAVIDINGNFYAYKTRHHLAVLVESSTYGFVYLDSQTDEDGIEILHFPAVSKPDAILRAGTGRVKKHAESSLRNFAKDDRFVDSFLAKLDNDPPVKVRHIEIEKPYPVYRERETHFVDPGTYARLSERFPEAERDPSVPLRDYLARLDGEEPCDNDSVWGLFQRMLRAKRFWPRRDSRVMESTEVKGHNPDVRCVTLTIEALCEPKHAFNVQKEMDAFAPYADRSGMFTGLTDAEIIDYEWTTEIS